MKLLLSGLNSLLVGGCCAALLVFLGVNLDKRPWWSWIVAAIAFGVIWEFAKAGIAKSVADRMDSEKVPTNRVALLVHRRVAQFHLSALYVQ